MGVAKEMVEPRDKVRKGELILWNALIIGFRVVKVKKYLMYQMMSNIAKLTRARCWCPWETGLGNVSSIGPYGMSDDVTNASHNRESEQSTAVWLFQEARDRPRFFSLPPVYCQDGVLALMRETIQYVDIPFPLLYTLCR